MHSLSVVQGGCANLMSGALVFVCFTTRSRRISINRINDIFSGTLEPCRKFYLLGLILLYQVTKILLCFTWFATNFAVASAGVTRRSMTTSSSIHRRRIDASSSSRLNSPSASYASFAAWAKCTPRSPIPVDWNLS